MRTVLLVMPELPYLGGLFLPDLQRARDLGAIVALSAGAEPGDPDVHVHVESGERTAVECARHLRGADPRVLALSDDERASALRFVDVLREHGRADARVVELAEVDPHCRAVLQGTAFTIAPSGARAMGVRFAPTPDGHLRRVTPGGCGYLPAWVASIRFDHEPDRDPRAVPLVDAARDVWHGFSFTPQRPLAVERDALCRLVERVGPDAVRLRDGSPRERARPQDAGGAMWAWRYGLPDPPRRERLLALVEAALPDHLPELATACVHCDLGIDPLREAWLGNAIADRNADLIVNIVP